MTQSEQTSCQRLMYLNDVMTAVKLRSNTDAAKLMRAVGIVMTNKGACVMREDLTDYCDKEGIALCL